MKIRGEKREKKQSNGHQREKTKIKTMRDSDIYTWAGPLICRWKNGFASELWASWWLRWYYPLAIQDTQVWSPGQEDPLEKGMAPRTSILAWRIPWTEETGGLRSIGLQRVRRLTFLLSLIYFKLCQVGKVTWLLWTSVFTSENGNNCTLSAHLAWGPSGMDGGSPFVSDKTLFWGDPKSLQMVTAAMKLKDACSLEEKLWLCQQRSV